MSLQVIVTIMHKGESKQQDINESLNTNIRNQESLTPIVITMMTIYTNQLRGTSYFVRGVVSACRASTLHCTSVLLARLFLLVVRALGMLRAPSHQSQGLRVFAPLAQCAVPYVLSSRTVPSVGDSSGRPGLSDGLQGRYRCLTLR